MQQKISHFMLSVKDMGASIAFYQQLGFHVQYQSDEWSELKNNLSDIELALRQSSGSQSSKEQYSGIGFVVDDCQAYSNQLTKKGLAPFITCQKNDDGATITKLHDPDGNVIWFTDKTL